MTAIRRVTYTHNPMWNQLPSSLRQPHSVHCPPGPPHPAHITSSQSPPSLSPSITPSTFHSRLKTHLFHKSFPSQSLLFPSGLTALTDLNLYLIKGALVFVCFNVFFLLYFSLATCAKAEYSAFESRLNSSIVLYHNVS